MFTYLRVAGRGGEWGGGRLSCSNDGHIKRCMHSFPDPSLTLTDREQCTERYYSCWPPLAHESRRHDEKTTCWHAAAAFSERKKVPRKRPFLYFFPSFFFFFFFFLNFCFCFCLETFKTGERMLQDPRHVYHAIFKPGGEGVFCVVENQKTDVQPGCKDLSAWLEVVEWDDWPAVQCILVKET